MYRRIAISLLTIGLVVGAGCKKQGGSRPVCEALEKNGYAKSCMEGSAKDWDYPSPDGQCKSVTTFSFANAGDEKRAGLVCEMENMQIAESTAKYVVGMNSVLSRDHVFIVNETVVLTVPLAKGYDRHPDESPRAAFEKVFGAGKITEVKYKP